MESRNAFDLSDRVAVVTGGSQGIGLGIAEAMARSGATVIIANRNPKEGEMAAARLCEAGGRATAFATDVTVKESLAATLATVVDRFGRVDVLVCNAGTMHKQPIQSIQDRHWDRLVGLNLRGTFNTLQIFGEQLTRQRHGRVICLGSIFSVRGESGRVLYAMTKGGIVMMVRTLAVEWAPYGITINALCPGLAWSRPAQRHYSEHPDQLAELLRRVPLGRVAQIEEVGNLAVFLASDAASYITGHTLMVDGGWSIAAMPVETP